MSPIKQEETIVRQNSIPIVSYHKSISDSA